VTSATRSVAEFVARASLGEALAHVEDVVAGALLDTYGVSLAGDATQAAQAARGLTGIQGLYDVAANATGSARADAAMLGGTAAHALDFDDYAHMGHASAVLIPTLLALSGERYGPSRFAEAYAAGYEVWERIARSAQPHYAAGFHTTATVGTLGAACWPRSARTSSRCTPASRRPGASVPRFWSERGWRPRSTRLTHRLAS
jgi:aconitate decarboxylase